MNYVPQSYEDWEHCITVKCRIPLTPGYVAARIAALEDSRDFHTEKFIARWGAAHHMPEIRIGVIVNEMSK